MTNQQLLLIIVALLAVIPAGVVFMVVWTRLMEYNTRINAALGGKEDINRIEQTQKDINTDLAKMKADIIGLDESFRNLVNKVNSRQRTEQIQERREKKEEQETDGPKFEQQEMFPAVFPLDKPTKQPEQQRRMVLQKKIA